MKLSHSFVSAFLADLIAQSERQFVFLSDVELIGNLAFFVLCEVARQLGH